MLTPKQQAFVAEYLVDLNASAAARRAGYSERAANRIATENLSKPVIAAAIQEALQARQQRTQVTADHVLRRLAEQDAADLADILNNDGSLKPVREWPPAWRRGLVTGVKVVTVGNADVGLGQVTEVKLADRMKNLELMGRHVDVGAWRDRVELAGGDGGPIKLDVSGMSTEALRELSEARRRAGKP